MSPLLSGDAAPAPETQSPSRLETPEGRSLAYHRLSSRGDGNLRPGVVFLGGFRSDMTGAKATRFEDWARGAGRAYLRFDYSGHGASSGDFEEGAIGDWAEDAYSAIQALTEGPQILVGSSMGGWISLLVIKKLMEQGHSQRIAGFIGIAAAPDFTEDSMTANLTEEQSELLRTKGKIEIPSDYSPDPYVITRRLLEDGRTRLVLREPLVLPFPVRLFQGTDDTDVEPSVALRLLNHIECPDAHLTLVKGAGHSMSEPRELELLLEAIERIA